VSLTAPDDPERLCLQCGKTLAPHAGERPNRFRRRKYCSIQCSGRATMRRNRWGWARGMVTNWNALDRIDDDLPTWVNHE
jgi:hypothetical protein